MPTAKLQLNSTQIPNYLLDDVMPMLSDTELRVVLVIARQTYGWQKKSDRISYSQLIKKTGKTSRTSIAKATKSLKEKDLIKTFTDGQDISYSINTSPESELASPENGLSSSPENGHTKETNTKVLSKDNSKKGKKPSCPLLNGSPLKEIYPNGHKECIEYYLSVEDRRGFNFINVPKQFNFIHKMLRAEIGFKEMNKVVPLIDKAYGQGNWDFATLVNWLEKGASRQ